MTVLGRCQACGSDIEYDSEYEGTQTDCPICTKPTALIPKPPKNYRKWILFSAKLMAGLLLATAAIALITLLGRYAVENPDIAQSVGGGIFGLAIIVVAIVLALLWIFFPWMVWLKFNELIREVKRLRK